MKFADYLSKDLVLLDLPCRTKSEVIEFMSKKVCEHYSLKCSLEITRAVFQREDICSTGVGGGLAVPNSKADVLDKVFVVFGRSVQGVDWQALDGQLVHYIFLVLAPERLCVEYLNVLSQISKILKRQPIKDILRQAKTPEEIIETIRRSGERKEKR